MEPATIAYPGSFFGTPHHYNVFMRGASPVTERLLKPTLVDARTAALTDTRDMPLHIRALFLSRPLHFGDYGGLPLRGVWAGLELVAIMVLVGGLYLWIARIFRILLLLAVISGGGLVAALLADGAADILWTLAVAAPLRLSL